MLRWLQQDFDDLKYLKHFGHWYGVTWTTASFQRTAPPEKSNMDILLFLSRLVSATSDLHDWLVHQNDIYCTAHDRTTVQCLFLNEDNTYISIYYFITKYIHTYTTKKRGTNDISREHDEKLNYQRKHDSYILSFIWSVHCTVVGKSNYNASILSSFLQYFKSNNNNNNNDTLIRNKIKSGTILYLAFCSIRFYKLHPRASTITRWLPRVFLKKSPSGNACNSTKRSLLGTPIDILIMRVAHAMVSRTTWFFMPPQLKKESNSTENLAFNSF